MTNLNVTGNITCQGGGVVVPIGTILDFAGVTSPQHYWNKNGTGTRISSNRELTFSATPSGTISNTGESGTNKNMMPYGVVNKIIRAK